MIGRTPGTMTVDEAQARREEQRRYLGKRKKDHERRIKNVSRLAKDLEKQIKPLERRHAVLTKAAELGHEGAARQRGVVGDELGSLRGRLHTYRSMITGSQQAIPEIERELALTGSTEAEERAHAEADAELETMAGERAEVEAKRAAKRLSPAEAAARWMDNRRRQGLVK